MVVLVYQIKVFLEDLLQPVLLGMPLVVEVVQDREVDQDHQTEDMEEEVDIMIMMIPYYLLHLVHLDQLQMVHQLQDGLVEVEVEAPNHLEALIEAVLAVLAEVEGEMMVLFQRIQIFIHLDHQPLVSKILEVEVGVKVPTIMNHLVDQV